MQSMLSFVRIYGSSAVFLNSYSPHATPGRFKVQGFGFERLYMASELRVRVRFREGFQV